MIIAIDTGGTKTLVALIDSRGKIIRQERFLTPIDTTEYIKVLKELLQTTFRDARVKAVVIALPGIIRDGVAVWCNNLGWRDFDVKKALKGVVDAPIFVENDANLAGLSEAHHLSPIPEAVLYVTVSTGIGTGIINHGKIDPALRHSEGGRALVEFDGQVREWESFASGRAIYETYKKFAAEITSKRTWDHIADRISRGFLAVIPILQPDTIVIGGSIGTYFARYAPQLEALLIEHLPSHIPTPRLVQAVDPEQAVIYGCYYYAKYELAH